MLYGHGDDLYNSDTEIKVNFSSNVWHGANLEDVRSHLYERFSALTHYPEPDAASLRDLLASLYQVEAQNVVVTNGSITAFYLLAQAWQGARSTIVIPSFAEYEDACRLYKHELSFYSTSADLYDVPLGNQDFCWLCNPNNPDGKLICREDLLRLIAAHPQTMFVIDQAYADFTLENLLSPSDIKRYQNLILIQSISKVHNIPGLRIGYLIASETITQRLNQFIIPWSVNSIAIETGKYVLTHPEQFILPVQRWREETKTFMRRLREIDDLEVCPSTVTFFLVRLKKGKAADLKRYLLRQHGLLIRDASNFRGLDETYFRLSTQLPEENEMLIKGIQLWLKRQ